jgi:hypothetical protein
MLQLADPAEAPGQLRKATRDVVFTPTRFGSETALCGRHLRTWFARKGCLGRCALRLSRQWSRRWRVPHIGGLGGASVSVPAAAPNRVS